MNQVDIERIVARLEGNDLSGIACFADRALLRDELELGAEWLSRARSPDGAALRARVLDALTRLGAWDDADFAALRHDIMAGTYDRATLRRLFDAHTTYVRGVPMQHVCVESLDALVDGVLALPRIEETGIAPGPELIHYEPAPASVVLELVDMLALTEGDVACDVGSGAGRIPMLLHLLTGATTLGIEIDAQLTRVAETARSALGFERVRFVNVDARFVDAAQVHDVRALVLVTPFKGKALVDALQHLRDARGTKPLTIVTFGPGTPWVADVPWLRLVSGDPNDEFRLARFETTVA